MSFWPCLDFFILSNDHYSLAGEFFPEAAQIAYKMWELSAMSKVQVWPLDLSLHVWFGSGVLSLNHLLLAAMGNFADNVCVLSKGIF